MITAELLWWITALVLAGLLAWGAAKWIGDRPLPSLTNIVAMSATTALFGAGVWWILGTPPTPLFGMAASYLVCGVVLRLAQKYNARRS